MPIDLLEKIVDIEREEGDEFIGFHVYPERDTEQEPGYDLQWVCEITVERKGCGECGRIDFRSYSDKEYSLIDAVIGAVDQWEKAK